MNHWNGALRRLSLALAALGAIAAPTAWAVGVADISASLDAGTTSLPLAIPAPGKFSVTVNNAGPQDATGVQVDLALPDGVSASGVSSNCVADGGGFPCIITGGVPNGTSAVVGFKLTWDPPTVPATCPTNYDLAATVSANETDPTSADNTSTIPAITVGVADITGTVKGVAGPLTDGGTPSNEPSPGQKITFTATVTNAGPCAADGVQIDGSLADTNSFGLNFVSGTGDCTPWTADGQCTFGNTLAPGQTASFSTTWTVLPFSDAGGDSIIQSAVVWNYNIAYNGNVENGSAASGSESPSFTTLVKGPGSVSCATLAGSPTGMMFLLAGAGLAMWLRRRRAR